MSPCRSSVKPLQARGVLRDALRALKLSETLDARLAQARGGELGHLEFLQILCHDEIGRRELTAMGRRLHRAHFDADTTMEEFDFHASPSCLPRKSVTLPRCAGCARASR